MTELIFSVPNHIANAIEVEAKKTGKSVPVFLQELVIAHIHPDWSETYKTNVLGSWHGDIPQRPEQVLPEERSAW